MAKFAKYFIGNREKTFSTLRNKTFLYSCKTSNQMKGYITYACLFNVLLTMVKYDQLNGLNSENKIIEGVELLPSNILLLWKFNSNYCSSRENVNFLIKWFMFVFCFIIEINRDMQAS